MNGWALPREAVIGGKTYPIHGDFRDVLEIFSYFGDRSLPEFIRLNLCMSGTSKMASVSPHMSSMVNPDHAVAS